MNINISNVLNFFKSNAELDLEYLYGYKFESIEHLSKLPKQSIFYQVLVFVKMILNPIIYGKQSCVGEHDYWFFFNTLNQKNSLDRVYKIFEGNHKSIIGFSFNRKIRKDYFSHVSFSGCDVFVALCVLFIRIPAMFRQLRSVSNPFVSFRRNWVKYAALYFYAAFYYRNFNRKKPKVIFISNDHNGEHRVLIYMSKIFDIKVAYVQHAHISDLYPSLSMDYAFLDGFKSLETYEGIATDVGTTSIFLTGNQKQLPHLKRITNTCDISCIGIALNLFDELEKVEEFIVSVGDNLYVDVRFHPTHNASFVSDLKEKFHGRNRVSFHSASEVSMYDYISRIDLLFAGESSIHLESALADVVSYLINFTSSELVDFYGFVDGGICQNYPCLIYDKEKLDLDFYAKNQDLVGRYSATYNTADWGKEDTLVYDTVMRLSELTSQKYKRLKSGNLYLL